MTYQEFNFTERQCSNKGFIIPLGLRKRSCLNSSQSGTFAQSFPRNKNCLLTCWTPTLDLFQLGCIYFWRWNLVLAGLPSSFVRRPSARVLASSNYTEITEATQSGWHSAFLSLNDNFSILVKQSNKLRPYMKPYTNVVYVWVDRMIQMPAGNAYYTPYLCPCLLSNGKWQKQDCVAASLAQSRMSCPKA